MEILIGGLIVLLAVYILYSNIKKSKSGCNCSNCSSKCPSYKENDKNKTGSK
ncbi:FeoB-associated Cys-rich membrane protein [Clostridium bornimense]|uniref:FeoB-associated Cys-rich membrane protein n=1 Tax=Clostridium bornimense TaxID=1216932 RepID=UPI001C11464F|nr:FeoB-associated Cys-rich membrane protein [Clostridium bornimense]MBU5315015.1 FeoB-associated Cys-rich membrane protein [Clostridium bornimense]